MSDTLRNDIKQAIVRSLRLPITADEIGDDVPLFGEGLGLDSIDVLELVLELERSFGVSISDEANRRARAAHGQHHRRIRRGESQACVTLNIFTVDVEEWFHVCGVGGHARPRELGRAAVARRGDDAPAARRARHRRRAGDVLRGRMGGGAASQPRRRRSCARATKSARTVIWHRRVYELTPDSSRRPCNARRAPLVDAGAPRPRVLSRAGMVDQRPRCRGRWSVLRGRGSPSTRAWLR